MCFFGTKPITEVVHRGARLQFFVDTGGQRTFLYPPFFRRYREEIRSLTKPVSAFYLKANRAVLVPVILHTTVNILPDIGFAAFRPSILLMILTTVGTALIVGSRREMRSEPL